MLFQLTLEFRNYVLLEDHLLTEFCVLCKETGLKIAVPASKEAPGCRVQRKREVVRVDLFLSGWAWSDTITE